MEVVLVRPKIPQNTGSVARTCAAVKVPLHLVGPLGFDISDKAVRRAGLDYWPYVELSYHENWECYAEEIKSKRCWYFTKFASRSLYEVKFERSDVLVFGDEIKGLGTEIINSHLETTVRIPMISPHVRSLNLSNAVSIGLYEALRQCNLV